MTPEVVGELDGIDLGDERLNERARQVLQAFWKDPQASINAALHNWSETLAGYRFLDNDRVAHAQILQPHIEATLGRISQHPCVLIVQDTTELDFSGHAPQGAGPLTYKKRQGFLDHTQLAFTPEGLCLGHVGADIYARSEEGFGESRQRQHDPIETKESYRWLLAYRRACEVAREVPGTKIICVADREGDIYELFVEAQQQGAAAAEFVIRAAKDRSLPDLDPEGSSATYLKLHSQMAQAPVIAARELRLPRTPKRSKRTAILEVRARRVRLKAPYRKHAKLPEIEVNVVLVREINPPPDVEPIEWLLITSLPIDTQEQVLSVLDTYTGRWPIEIYFRTYKVGCKVEEIQLETAARLLRCLMLYKIVAWQIMYATMLGRACPDLPCDVLFTADEWKPVWKITRQQPLPTTAPPLADFLLLLASLGGHNGRRCDGPPGPQSLWIGIRRMMDFAIAWRAFGPERAKEPPEGDTCV
jgi:hypothetical protein